MFIEVKILLPKTEILKMDVDWVGIKNECRNTVNKEFTESEPSEKFKRDLLISEHSPCRLATIRFRWEGIKSWVSVHFARHWLGWDKFVSTQREDRTGVDRDSARQDAPVNMDVNANPQALINVARFRLCQGQTHPQTRAHMVSLKFKIKDSGQKEIAYVMVPNCVYRCGCPEIKPCPFFETFSKIANDEYVNLLDIRQRYDLYDRLLEKTERGK